MTRTLRFALYGLAAAGCAALACNSSTAPQTGQGTLSLNIGTGYGAAGKAGTVIASSTPESYTLGSDTIVFDRVELVLKSIHFKGRADSLRCDEEDSLATGDHLGADSSDGRPEDHNHDCDDTATGPYLFDVPLGGAVARELALPVPAGTYDGVDFRIHKPRTEPGDDTFLSLHPDFSGVSIRAHGTYNGTEFTFSTDDAARSREALVPAITVATGADIQVTLKVDLAAWFANAGATGFVDPASALAGGPNAFLVRHNIRAAFHAFRDDNRDGHDDDGQGHH